MNNQNAEAVKVALSKVAKSERIPILQRFYKTGKGEYAENDVLIGVRVPDSRVIAKQFGTLSLAEINNLLDSPIHEHRQVGLFIMVYRYQAASRRKPYDENTRDELNSFYLEALRRGRVNNWDLIDCSAEHLLGNYLLNRSRLLLFTLASSEMIWQRRAAVIATFAFIKQKDASTTLELAEKLLDDEEPLIHKAVGWMLREVGKKCAMKTLTSFLDKHAAQMPRVMLRYAVEKLSAEKRKHYYGCE